VKRYNGMPPVVFASRQTNVPYHTDEATAWHEDPEAVLPNLVEFGQKLLVVTNET
jgi:hypothetical protein